MAQRNLKEQIVEAASRVLFAKGFHAASVNDIVADADVPKGSFYNHFESKDALALEVVRRYAESYDIASLRSDDGPPLRRLRAHFASVIERTAARGVALGCMLGNFSTELASHSPRISEYVAGALAYWSDAVASCLLQAQDAGELASTVDTGALGRYLVDAYEGAVARAKVTNDRAPLDAFITMTFDVLIPTVRLAPKQRPSGRGHGNR